MTEKLKTLMDESSDLQFAAPDLDAIVRDGDRTVRRRRIVTGAAGLAAAAVVATSAIALTGGTGVDRTADPTGAPDGPVAEWAAGSVLHTQTGPVDVGHPVRAYVRTAAGYVVADDLGTVWSVVGGEVRQAGYVDARHPRLVGDDDTATAAWVDPGTEGRHLVAYDQTTRQATVLGPVADGAEVDAVDGGRVYLTEDGSVRVVPVGRGPEAVLDPPAAHASFLGWEDGVAVWWADHDGQSEYLVGRTEMQPVVIPNVRGDLAMLSPDATWVSLDADEPRVFDTSTGQQVQMDVDGRDFATGYAWLDDDTLLMVAGRSTDGPIELLVCAVPEGTCSDDPGSAGQLGTFADSPIGFALPIGSYLGDG